MITIIKKIIPWLITFTALYYAFNDLNWENFFAHLTNVSIIPIFLAFVIMVLSYPLRAYRWQFLLPHENLTFWHSLRVLVLGFFMNNILPARAGEFVRAHVGGKVIGEKRTKVLASIVSERLADGVTISLLFAIFSLKLGDSSLSKNFLYVSLGFGTAGIGAIIVIIFRETLFTLLQKLTQSFSNKAIHYALTRAQSFIEGLSPLCNRKYAPAIVILSIIIWLIELSVYLLVTHAYGSELSFAACVLFMVAVNFSGLIPAAPGGLGVIEAVASSILVSLGIERELALTMVVTQHIMQYLVVGAPGAFILLNLKKYVDAPVEDA